MDIDHNRHRCSTEGIRGLHGGVRSPCQGAPDSELAELKQAVTRSRARGGSDGRSFTRQTASQPVPTLGVHCLKRHCFAKLASSGAGFHNRPCLAVAVPCPASRATRLEVGRKGQPDSAAIINPSRSLSSWHRLHSGSCCPDPRRRKKGLRETATRLTHATEGSNAFKCAGCPLTPLLPCTGLLPAARHKLADAPLAVAGCAQTLSEEPAPMSRFPPSPTVAGPPFLSSSSPPRHRHPPLRRRPPRHHHGHRHLAPATAGPGWPSSRPFL